jgi:hypothetical protein
LSSWWHRSRVKSEVQRSGRPVAIHRVTNPYHAVSIAAGPKCRRTAEKFGERRFLSLEAPPLPQPTCDTLACRCRYVHHEDRRDGSDRRHRDVWDPAAQLAKGGDRRRGQGRRSTDH